METKCRTLPFAFTSALRFPFRLVRFPGCVSPGGGILAARAWASHTLVTAFQETGIAAGHIARRWPPRVTRTPTPFDPAACGVRR